MDWLMWIPLLVYVVFGLGAIVLAICCDPGGGSWVKEDGTIIEWDGKGGGRVLHPDGRLEEFHA